MNNLAKLLAILIVAGIVLAGCASDGGEAALPPSGSSAAADSGKQNAPVSGTGQIVDHGTQRTLKGH